MPDQTDHGSPATASEPSAGAATRTHGATADHGSPATASEPPADESTPDPSPRPLLASEALKDDLAPIEPLRAAARMWGAGIGAFFACLSFAPGRPTPHVATPVVDGAAGVAALVVAAAPLSYRVRAVAMVAIAVAVGFLGVLGVGPASVLAQALGEWGLLHLIAATVVPAGLMFRARYRAYRAARPILAAALALALPFASYCAIQIDAAQLAVQVASGVALCALCTSLFGFMGSQTGIGGDYLATAIIASLTAQLATQAAAALVPAEPAAWLWLSASSLAFAGAVTMCAIGVFQLLALRHWGRARKVEVHSALSEPPSAPPSAPSSLTDSWSTRA